MRIFLWIKSWYRGKPDIWKKKLWFKFSVFVVNILGIAFISYITSIIVVTGCNLVSDRISGSINRNLTQLADPYLKPKLEWAVMDFRLGDLGAQVLDTTNTRLAIVRMEIFNSGFPSIVRNWQLKAAGSNGQTVYGKSPIPEPPQITAVDSNGKTNEVLILSNSLREKTKDNAIGHGESRDGYVVFVFPGVNKEFLAASTTLYTLSFEDVADTNYVLPPFSAPAPNP